MQILPITITAISAIILLTACPKRKPRCKPYEPFIPVYITMANDSISVGDTFYLRACFNHTLFDSVNMKNITFENFDFKSWLTVKHITRDTTIFNDKPGGMKYFAYQVDSGKFGSSYDSVGGILSYSYLDDLYYAKMRFIAKDTGLYCFFLGYDGDIRFREIMVTPNSPCKESMQFVRYRFNDGDNNLPLLENNVRFAENYYNGIYTPQQLYEVRNSTFTFYVKP